MSSQQSSIDRILEYLTPALTAEIERSVQEALKQQQEELETKHDQALRELRTAGENAAIEFRAYCDTQLRTAEAAWAAERARLEDELAQWRTYAEAQRMLGESKSQPEMLGRFLELTKPFARSLAIYVMKADGLVLWKMRGDAFSDVVSPSTIDPEWFYAPVVVRDRTVAAVCAQVPFRPETLHFLVESLARTIEIFGMKLHTVKPRQRVIQEQIAMGN
jgi:hypothetical protein